MVYDPDKHHRRSIRLRQYNYSQAGAYFMTICAQDRACLFGEIVDAEMRLNDAGRMVERWWAELNRKFPTVQTDEYVVMPNHFHGIVITVGADLCVCPDPHVCSKQSGAPSGAQGAHATQGAHTPPDEQGVHAEQGVHIGAPLPGIVQWFKTMTTNEYIRVVKTSGWPTFRGRLWQRNYYEHILRNEESLQRIRRYIAENPPRWEMDRENPNATHPEKEDAWRA